MAEGVTMPEAAADANPADVVPGVEQGPRKPVKVEDLIPDTKGEGEPASAAENAESTQNAQDPPAGGKREAPERALAKSATSASDGSGDLVALLRGLDSGGGGLSQDRALLGAEAIGALFSAPGGMSVQENAATVIQELERAGVDVGKMLTELAEVSARDRTAVAARKLQDGLRDVLALVHQMAAATTSRVDVHLSGFDERAQGVLTAALMAQAVLDRLESNGRQVIARVDEVHRGTEKLSSVVGAARVEVEAAAKAGKDWVENAGVVGRGVWWYALLGGVLGGVLSGLFMGLVQRAVAGL